MAEDAPTTVTAYIYIYKGSWGIDWSEKRHTLLSFSFTNGAKTVVVHAAGSKRDYRAESIDGYKAAESDNVVGFAELGALQAQISKKELVKFMLETKVDNEADDWNCQSWVGDAMERMLKAGWITNRIYHNGLDQMADVILEAKDEHMR